ncbi:MAG: hypothetical protein V7L03_06820 [Nostoc sp.]
MSQGIGARQGSIHFWKKHNSGTPKTLLYSSSKKVDPPKVDAPHGNAHVVLSPLAYNHYPRHSTPVLSKAKTSPPQSIGKFK